MKATIRYAIPGDPIEEQLKCRSTSPTIAVLEEHSGFMPLGPGDVVTVDPAGLVTGVHSLTPMFTYEVEFYLPADIRPFTAPTEDHRSMKAVADAIEQWSRDAWVTQHTNFTALVSSPSHEWLKEHVLDHRFVEHVELIRVPDTAIDFNVAIQHPDLDGTREGPWA